MKKKTNVRGELCEVTSGRRRLKMQHIIWGARAVHLLPHILRLKVLTAETWVQFQPVASFFCL